MVSDGPLSIGDPKNTFRGPTPEELTKMMSDQFLPTNNVVLDQNTFDHPKGQIGAQVAVTGCRTTNVQITNNRERNVPGSANPIWIAAYAGCSSSGVTVSGNTWLLTTYNGYTAPVESQSKGGPFSGHFCKRPVSVETPARLGPRH